MRKVKVAHIITKLELGGAQKNVLHITTHLNSSKYDVSLLSSTEGILVEDALKAKQVKTYFLPTLRRQVSLFADLKTLFTLSKFLKKEKFEIIHTHSSKAGILGRWAAWIAGAPIIVHTIHGWSFHNPQNWVMRNLYAFLEKMTAMISARLVTVSAYDIQKGLDAKVGTKDKYQLIRYGIRAEDFSRPHVNSSALRKQLGLGPESPVVGMVACLKPQKAPQDFITAASYVAKVIPEVRFLLVGEGVLRKKVERLIEKLDLRKRVILTGWRRDISALMSLFDVFVLSSLWEGSPIVFLEAMACGLPIVATDTGATSELVRDGVNGFLVAPGDCKALAQRMLTLLEDKFLAEQMGGAGKQFLSDRRFDEDYMVSQIEELYDELIKEKSRCCCPVK